MTRPLTAGCFVGGEGWVVDGWGCVVVWPGEGVRRERIFQEAGNGQGNMVMQGEEDPGRRTH